MSKKDFLKSAASRQVNRALGNAPEQENSNPAEETLKESKENIQADKGSERKTPVEPEGAPQKKERTSKNIKEKKLLKNDTIYKVNRAMRLEDYTAPAGGENKSKKYLILAGGIFVLWLIWFFWPAGHAIFMDANKMTPEKVNQMDPKKEYEFKNGQDFFVYYRKGWGTPKILNIRIFKVDGDRAEIHTYSRPFKKEAEKAQTYYDETFFESSGKYEMEIRNEKDEVLVTKKFTIN